MRDGEPEQVPRHVGPQHQRRRRGPGRRRRPPPAGAATSASDARHSNCGREHRRQMQRDDRPAARGLVPAPGHHQRQRGHHRQHRQTGQQRGPLQRLAPGTGWPGRQRTIEQAGAATASRRRRPSAGCSTHEQQRRQRTSSASRSASACRSPRSPSAAPRTARPGWRRRSVATGRTVCRWRRLRTTPEASAVSAAQATRASTSAGRPPPRGAATNRLQRSPGTRRYGQAPYPGVRCVDVGKRRSRAEHQQPQRHQREGAADIRCASTIAKTSQSNPARDEQRPGGGTRQGQAQHRRIAYRSDHQDPCDAGESRQLSTCPVLAANRSQVFGRVDVELVAPVVGIEPVHPPGIGLAPLATGQVGSAVQPGWRSAASKITGLPGSACSPWMLTRGTTIAGHRHAACRH